MNDDIIYMKMALALAEKGVGWVNPNPMVGAVIVHEGRIIGEGWHRHFGGPHAEVNAVQSVRPADESLLPNSTIYVNLEPCSHWGKTPPCAELLVEKGFRRVVVGCQDPNEKVAGRGIRRLREAGTEVVEGVLETECRHLNRRFITFHTQHRPWVTLKWAESADHFIDRRRESHADGEAIRFSSPWTQMLVHRLRATRQAIVVGRRTWELDAPRLDCRLWPGSSPERFIFSHADYDSPATLLTALYAKGVQSLLVEGGAQTLQAFLDADLWDEAYIEHSPILLGEGIAAPKMKTDPKQRPVFVNFA